MNRLISYIAGVTFIVATVVAAVAMDGPFTRGVSGTTTAATSGEGSVSVNRESTKAIDYPRLLSTDCLIIRRRWNQ